MRTASFLLLFVLGGDAITLAIGKKPASVAPLLVTGQELTATDTNSIDRKVDQDHGTEVGGSRGTSLDTPARPGTSRDRKAHVGGSRGTSLDTLTGLGTYTVGATSNSNDTAWKAGSAGSSGARISPSQDATNGNTTNQTRDDLASTGEVDVRAPVGCQLPNQCPRMQPVPEVPTATQTPITLSSTFQEALIGRR